MKTSLSGCRVRLWISFVERRSRIHIKSWINRQNFKFYCQHWHRPPRLLSVCMYSFVYFFFFCSCHWSKINGVDRHENVKCKPKTCFHFRLHSNCWPAAHRSNSAANKIMSNDLNLLLLSFWMCRKSPSIVVVTAIHFFFLNMHYDYFTIMWLMHLLLRSSGKPVSLKILHHGRTDRRMNNVRITESGLGNRNFIKLIAC